MNILVLNCSPVRDGATALIAEIISDTVKRGNTVRCACIDDYQIGLCRGCRECHRTARCFQRDGAEKLMAEFEWAEKIVAVSPSYWADVPGQFKVFIDRCTPWCNTHEPHASLSGGKKGYAVALRTGPGIAECERIIHTLEHFYGHLEIVPGGGLCLCGVTCREDAAKREAEIRTFCENIAKP